MTRFLLNRNLAEAKYELVYQSKNGAVTLSEFDSLEHAMERGTSFAKRLRGELLVSELCVSDWYCGIPRDSSEPQTIQEPPAGLTEATVASYRVLEGPFVSEEEAKQAGEQLKAIMAKR